MAWLDTLKKALGVAGVETPKVQDVIPSISDLKQIDLPQINDAYKNIFSQQSSGLGDLRTMDNIPQTDTSPSMLDKLGTAYKSALGKMPSWGDVLPAAASVGGSVLGYQQSKKGMEDANRFYNQALDTASAPAYTVSDEMFKGIEDNPDMLAARQEALTGMRERATMGLTPSDMLELNKIRNQSNQQFQAQTGQIQDQMAKRGMANSGMNLVQQQMAAQQQANQNAEAGDRQAAMAFENKQNALKSLGGMSSDYLNQDFTRSMNKAQNLDAINRFNAQQQATRQSNLVNAQSGMGNIKQQQGAAKGTGLEKIGTGIGGALGAIRKDQNQQKK